MAVRFLVNDVSDLCLGKPALRCLSVSATVGDAISFLRRSVDCCVSVWSCDHSSKKDLNAADDDFDGCTCVGKVYMVDIVCFLCREDNLLDPAAALQSSVEAVIPKSPWLVQHLDPKASLLEAIEVILEGAQNLVVPIQSRSTAYSRKKLLLNQSSTCSTLHNNLEYCWLTQEDILRYLLNSIAIFNPIPVQPIKTLDIINTDSLLSIHYDDPASSILPLIPESQATQTAIAVVDSMGRLIGEISPGSLSSCDLTVVAALKTLSAGDLMAYIDCGGPPEDLAQVVKSRLQEMNLDTVLEFICDDELGSIGNVSSPSAASSSSSSSSDEEFGLARIRRSGSYAKMGGRGSEAIVCYPWNSLIAVMIQALTHRVNYVWVVEQDATLTGIVTFASMMKLFHERLKSMS